MHIVRGSNGKWQLLAADGGVIAEYDDLAAFGELGEAITASVQPDALIGQPDADAAAGAAAGEQLVEGLAAAGDTAALFEVAAHPPREWFDDPQFTDATTVPAPGCTDVRGCPLTITADGRVFGHAALWETCHIGFEGECVPPPHSPSGYAYYRTGQTQTDGGDMVATGRLTIGTGHASTDRRNPISATAAAAHYDNTGTAVSDVASGEDKYGIWVAGAIRPGATVAQVEALRRSALSGDWRRIRGSLEMVAALAVNVPGYPVPRYGLAAAATLAEPVLQPVEVRDDDGAYALVAAGSPTLRELSAGGSDTERLRLRVDELERQFEAVAPLLAPLAAGAARARLSDALAAAATQPYGDVNYADPGYLKDRKKRYPLDTKQRVQAAIRYISQRANAAQYSSSQLSSIKGKIKAAAKKFDVEVASDF